MCIEIIQTKLIPSLSPWASIFIDFNVAPSTTEATTKASITDLYKESGRMLKHSWSSHSKVVLRGNLKKKKNKKQNKTKNLRTKNFNH